MSRKAHGTSEVEPRKHTSSALPYQQCRGLFARICRDRNRRRQGACWHAEVPTPGYGEQRERKMRSILSLHIRAKESGETETGEGREHGGMRKCRRRVMASNANEKCAAF